jgi:hypothetical protein
MTFDPGSNSAQQGSVGATATQQQGPAVPAQQHSAYEAAQHGQFEGTQPGPIEAEATPEVKGPLAGDPLSLGLPAFIVGSVALGMVLVGFVSPLGTGASLPIILAATALGLLISTLWAMAVGQSAVAAVLGVFAGFWLSYAFFVLGLQHGWFGVGIGDVKYGAVPHRLDCHHQHAGGGDLAACAGVYRRAGTGRCRADSAPLRHDHRVAESRQGRRCHRVAVRDRGHLHLLRHRLHGHGRQGHTTGQAAAEVQGLTRAKHTSIPVPRASARGYGDAVRSGPGR